MVGYNHIFGFLLKYATIMRLLRASGNTCQIPQSGKGRFVQCLVNILRSDDFTYPDFIRLIHDHNLPARPDNNSPGEWTVLGARLPPVFDSYTTLCIAFNNSLTPTTAMPEFMSDMA